LLKNNCNFHQLKILDFPGGFTIVLEGIRSGLHPGGDGKMGPAIPSAGIIIALKQVGNDW
jgi:hypothetical protein